MIVSDSSSLIVLLDLNATHFLSNLYPQILIPPAVESEITDKKKTKLPDFFITLEPREDVLLDELLLLLDRGESEAILLAKQKKLPLIIDEKKGRQIASNINIKIIGLIGIIYVNIKRGFLTKNEAKQFLTQVQEHGFRISQKLIDDLFSKF